MKNKISSTKQKKKFRKVIEWQEFISNKKGDREWGIIFLLAIPIIGTFIVLLYLLLGREGTYFEEVEE